MIISIVIKMINARAWNIRMPEIMIGMVSILMCVSAFRLLLSCCSTRIETSKARCRIRPAARRPEWPLAMQAHWHVLQVPSKHADSAPFRVELPMPAGRSFLRLPVPVLAA
jgi:hypothetical protein